MSAARHPGSRGADEQERCSGQLHEVAARHPESVARTAGSRGPQRPGLAEGNQGSGIGVLQVLPQLGNHESRTDGYGEAEFSEDATDGVNPCGAIRDPGGSKSVERRDGLLLDGFDWNGSHILIAERLEQALGVSSVSLVAADIWTDQVGRK